MAHAHPTWDDDADHVEDYFDDDAFFDDDDDARITAHDPAYIHDASVDEDDDDEAFRDAMASQDAQEDDDDLDFMD